MPLTRSAKPQQADMVPSESNRPPFHCPDIGAVDGHLAELRRILRLHQTHPDAHPRIRADIDHLLDRRALFMSVQWASDLNADEAQA